MKEGVVQTSERIVISVRDLSRNHNSLRFQSMKSYFSSHLLKFFYYVTCFGETRNWRPCKRGSIPSYYKMTYDDRAVKHM